jgi:hypothetical protein
VNQGLTVAGGAGPIAAIIGQLLTEGGDGNYAIFDVNKTLGYYAQILAQPSGSHVYVEVVGDENLDESRGYDSRQKGLLASRYWVPADEGGNLYREWVVMGESDRIRIAEELLYVFTEIFMASPSQSITIDLNLE